MGNSMGRGKRRVKSQEKIASATDKVRNVA